MPNLDYDEYQSKTGFTYFWGRLKVLFYNRTQTDELLTNKVDKVSGKGLATVDTISVNGTAVTVDENRNANIEVPTTTSALTNDSDFQTSTQVNDAISAALEDIEGITYNFDYASVAELPATGEDGTIYFIPVASSFQETTDETFQEGKEYFELVEGNYIHTQDTEKDPEKTYYELKTGANRFDEYVWSRKYQSYEMFGTATIDTSTFWTRTNLVAITTEEIDEILAS